MDIQLINGYFSAQDATEILTQFIQTKIKFHESKISPSSTEEDIKMRESRIKQLQNELHKVRQHLESTASDVSINASASVG